MELKNLDKAHELKEMLDCVNNLLLTIENIYSSEGPNSPFDQSFDLLDYDTQLHLCLTGAGVAQEVIDSIKSVLGNQKNKIISQVEKL